MFNLCFIEKRIKKNLIICNNIKISENLKIIFFQIVKMCNKNMIEILNNQ